MKYKGILVLLMSISLFAAGCRKTDGVLPNAQSATSITLEDSGSPKPEEDRTDIVLKFRDRIHPSMPEYTFAVYGRKEDYGYSANKIVIFNANGDVIQQITFDKTETADGERLGFYIEDMNFDGYKDLRIQQFLPAGPNIPYYYWLWDKNTSRYVRNKELEEITSPEFDDKDKVIKSTVRDSASTYYERVYKYIDGKPTLFRETERVADMDKKIWHVTVRELKGSEMKVISKYNEPFRD